MTHELAAYRRVRTAANRAAQRLLSEQLRGLLVDQLIRHTASVSSPDEAVARIEAIDAAGALELMVHGTVNGQPRAR